MISTVLATCRNVKGLLFVLPFLALPRMTVATPAISKQGAWLVLLVSLRRTALQ